VRKSFLSTVNLALAGDEAGLQARAGRLPALMVLLEWLRSIASQAGDTTIECRRALLTG
jgi:hypothetical protein